MNRPGAAGGGGSSPAPSPARRSRSRNVWRSIARTPPGGIRGARRLAAPPAGAPGVGLWDEFDQEPGGESAEELGEALHPLVFVMLAVDQVGLAPQVALLRVDEAGGIAE